MADTNLAGAFRTQRKDGSIYYRASITYRNKHISLGSFDLEADAHQSYLEAQKLISSPDLTIQDHTKKHTIPFEKWVVLCNFRDNGIYISNPIYVRPGFFYYYFGIHDFLLFSNEDLFYYSAHKIQRRGGHLFVADYGSQINILSRYGIKSHAIKGKDYRFINGNSQDMQYSNIEVLNSYHGVSFDESINKYKVKIHVNGYLQVGIYDSAIEAAIAYNKAVDALKEAGITKAFATNYVDEISAKAYADLYTLLPISDKITSLRNQ